MVFRRRRTSSFASWSPTLVAPSPVETNAWLAKRLQKHQSWFVLPLQMLSRLLIGNEVKCRPCRLDPQSSNFILAEPVY